MKKLIHYGSSRYLYQNHPDSQNNLMLIEDTSHLTECLTKQHMFKMNSKEDSYYACVSIEDLNHTCFECPIIHVPDYNIIYNALKKSRCFKSSFKNFKELK